MSKNDHLSHYCNSIFVCVNKVINGVNSCTQFADRFWYAILSAVILLYLGSVSYLASHKLFWSDEIFTIYVSRLASLDLIWDALKQGADFNPPLLYVLTYLSTLAMGETHVTVRLPAIIGFGIFCLSLFRFISIRSSTVAGLISMLFPLVSGAYWYAYDARTYGLVLGFGGLALISWQAAASVSGSRILWLILLGMALSCAFLTHSYAVLLLLPVTFGEIARTVQLRRPDWAVWAAIILSCIALLPSIILMRSALSAIGGYEYYRPTLLKMVAAYDVLLMPGAIIMAGFLLISVVIPRNKNASLVISRHPFHEIVCIFTLCLLPIFAYLLSKIAGGPFVARYSLSAIAGFACLCAIAFANRPVLSWGALLTLVAAIASNDIMLAQRKITYEPSSSLILSTSRTEFQKRYDQIQQARHKGLPIAIVDGMEYLPTLQYAPDGIRSTLIYLYREESDLFAIGYSQLKRCCGFFGNVRKVEDFLQDHKKFYVYTTLTSLQALGVFVGPGNSLALERVSGAGALVLVTFNGPA